MVAMDSAQQIKDEKGQKYPLSFPNNWQLCSLGEITTFSQYGISSSSGGIYFAPILKMNNLQDGHIVLEDLDYMQLSKAEMESLRLNKGDLLINRTNSIDLVGKTAIYDLEGEHVFASYLVRFRLGPSVFPSFISYFLNSVPGQRELKLLATKAVSQANINPSVIKKRLLIPLPPLPEQQAIAAALSDVDSLIASLDKLIAKKRAIKQATMQQLLTGKKRLPGFSGEWEVKKIGEIAEIDSDNLKSSTDPDYQFRYISLEDVDVGVLRSYSDISFRNAPSRARRKVKKNDILVSTVRPNLKSHLYINDEFTNLICSTGFSVLRCYQSLADPRYVYFHLFTDEVGQKIESLLIGSNYPAINSGDVKALQIPLPSLNEQQAIAAVLSDMDTEIAALEQRRDKTRALKHGMMQELLTGKTRLL